ncbi:MAG: glycosyltransferase family A protein [Acetobacteraceae bacterium]
MHDTPPAVSLVIASYQMTRQLRRTLLSLAPPYQRLDGIGPVEVIVVDNGSDPPPTPADLVVEGLALSLHLWPNPGPSPVAAMNFGLSLARAPIIAAMIDGARLASPGLIAAGVRGCSLHPRPVVATYNYHLGPKPQNQSVHEGYDAATEDALLAKIDWPRDGYRLFEIAAPEVGQGWPGPLLESNALFLPRPMWDALGHYDARFISPGGGGANHDLFRRACELPGAQLIKVAGEGTFHQVHGGRVTNARDQRPLRDSGVEYGRIRGRTVALLRQPGWLFDPRTGLVTSQTA